MSDKIPEPATEEEIEEINKDYILLMNLCEDCEDYEYNQ